MRGSSPRMTRELCSLRPRLCSAPLREVLRAALRPGHVVVTASEKIFRIPYPAPQSSLILRVSCPMRGASRGVTEVGQSASLAGAGQPKPVGCGVRGCASQAQTRRLRGCRQPQIPRWSVRKALFVTTKARLSALHLPSKRGDQLKAQLARRREDESAWLFEIRIRKLRETPPHIPRHTRA
jgi:hypothetical protein